MASNKGWANALFPKIPDQRSLIRYILDTKMSWANQPKPTFILKAVHYFYYKKNSMIRMNNYKTKKIHLSSFIRPFGLMT